MIEWQNILDQASETNSDFLANEVCSCKHAIRDLSLALSTSQYCISLQTQLFEKLGLKDSPQAQTFINMLYEQGLRNVEQQAALACLAHALIAHPKTPEARKEVMLSFRPLLSACLHNYNMVLSFFRAQDFGISKLTCLQSPDYHAFRHS
jgi:hypothetical protein